MVKMPLILHHDIDDLQLNAILPVPLICKFVGCTVFTNDLYITVCNFMCSFRVSEHEGFQPLQHTRVQVVCYIDRTECLATEGSF